MTQTQTSSPDHLVVLYGDLLFDLCESVLWSPLNAQVAFRAIVSELRRQHSNVGYQTHQREWVLRVACNKLHVLSDRHSRKVTASEQIQLDSNPSSENRLKHFDYYFHRLTVDEQILLLLRDKYGLPYGEIASALAVPEGSLKIRRSQALRALEEWLWDPTPAGTA